MEVSGKDIMPQMKEQSTIGNVVVLVMDVNQAVISTVQAGNIPCNWNRHIFRLIVLHNNHLQ
jgi:hypothetical protein